jgi:arsenate reductase-like glutaredoxin family protein
VAVATEMGVDFEEIRYMKEFPDEKTLRALIEKLEDPVERLVRKDSQFKKLELNEDDYVGNVDAVVEVLDRYHRLLERPVIVGPKKAIVGRPLDGKKAKERLAEIFSS